MIIVWIRAKTLVTNQDQRVVIDAEHVTRDDAVTIQITLIQLL
jgi:hypothetical protein